MAGGAMLDQKARDQMIQDHMGLVKSLARKIRNRYCPTSEMDELISLGSAGLVQAADRWDPGKGASFSTFAYYRVRGAIIDGLRQQGPLRRSQRLRFAAGAGAVLQDEADREPGAPAGAATEQLTGLARTLGDIAAVFVVSLDDPERVRQMPDPNQPEIHEQLAAAETSAMVRRAMKQLPQRERALIRLHYFKDMNLTEAGEKLGLSRSWACRLHARAIRRLSELIPRLE